MRRIAVVAIALMMLMAMTTSTALAKNGMTQFSGEAVVDEAGECPDPPEGYEDYVFLTLRLSGDLQGCWYTLVEGWKDNGEPSGVYREWGREIFVSDEGPMFTTTYQFESKWDPQFIVSEDPLVFGAELHGRCQHPIDEGFEGYEGIEGRVDFKDDVDTGVFYYRGHMRLSS